MNALIRQYGLVLVSIIACLCLVGSVYQIFLKEIQKSGVVEDGRKADYTYKASKVVAPILEVKDKQLSVGEVFDVRDLADAKDYDGSSLKSRIQIRELEGDLLGVGMKAYQIDTSREGVSWLSYRVIGKSGIEVVKRAVVIIDWR